MDEPGVLVDQNECLASFKKREFFFFRENSVRKSSLISSTDQAEPDLLLDEIKDITRMSQDTSEFNVAYLSKWMKVQFKIGLSKDYIELEEIKVGHLGIGGKKMSNFYSIPMRNVVGCEVLQEGQRTRNQIRIVIVEEGECEVSSYKHLDFECALETAVAIRSKCANLMSFLNSALVHEFNPEVHTTSKWSRKLYQSNRRNSKMMLK